jgi:hypothetical protein
MLSFEILTHDVGVTPVLLKPLRQPRPQASQRALTLRLFVGNPTAASQIPAHRVLRATHLASVRIPAKLNGQSDDVERGPRRGAWWLDFSLSVQHQS